jgi:HK97 family phage portal protein
VRYLSIVKWPWQRQPEAPANTSLSIADPLLVQYFTPGGLVDLAGVTVGETSALGLSALYRALSLVSGTLASLPLNTWTGQGTERKKVPSIFDDPDGPDQQTVYEWKESVFLHLLLHGRAGALKVRNEAGGLVRLPLVHPLAFQVVQPTVDEFQSGKLPAGGVWFEVSLNDGERVRLDADDFWYVPGPSLGYQVGISLLAYARQSLGTAIAGDKAAAKTFSSGALISGLATPSDEGFDLTEDIPQIRQELNRSVLGHENAGTIALVNRRLQFTPWTMTAQQAQFLESRQFQIEEISRWTGVPPHLLMQTDKQTSWGTGVDEQNRGLSKFVLGHWAQRFEQRASRLLARPRWCEFDFAGLERPNFAVEIDLLIKQVAAGILTLNEAREIRNLPPLPDSPPDVEKSDDEGAGDEPPPE